MEEPKKPRVEGGLRERDGAWALNPAADGENGHDDDFDSALSTNRPRSCSSYSGDALCVVDFAHIGACLEPANFK